MNNVVTLVSSVSIVAAFLGGITVALTQLVKSVWITNTRYAPLVSLVVGVILAYLFIGELDVPFRVLVGIIIGLTASGFYSGVKTVSAPGASAISGPTDLTQ